MLILVLISASWGLVWWFEAVFGGFWFDPAYVCGFCYCLKKKRSSGDDMLWKMISRWFWYYLRYFVEGFMIWCFLCVCVCAPPRARAWIDLIVEVWFGKKYEFCCLKFASSLLMLRFGTHVIFIVKTQKSGVWVGEHGQLWRRLVLGSMGCRFSRASKQVDFLNSGDIACEDDIGVKNWILCTIRLGCSSSSSEVRSGDQSVFCG